MAALVRDSRYGRAREMLVLGLGRMPSDPRATRLLIELLRDDEVAGHALRALATMKAGVEPEIIEPLLKHREAWVRKEAKKVLAKSSRPSQPPERAKR